MYLKRCILYLPQSREHEPSGCGEGGGGEEEGGGEGGGGEEEEEEEWRRPHGRDASLLLNGQGPV